MSRRAWLSFLILVPVCLRVIYVLQILKNPFFNLPIVDGRTYDNWAMEIVRGDLVGQRVFWQPPLYAYFMALVYAVFGHSYLIFRLVQSVLGSMNCLLVYLIGRRIAGAKVATIAFLIVSIYGPLIHFDTELLPVTLFIFLMLGALYVSLLRPKHGLLSGMLVGLSAITHGTGLLLAFAALGWFFFTRRKQFVPCLVGLLLPIALVTARNYAVGNDFVLVSYSGGINFYIGNNADYELTTNIRPGREWQGFAEEPTKLGVHKPSAYSNFYYRKAVDFITSKPADYLKLMLKKVFAMLNGNEIMRNQSIYPFREYSRLLATLLFKHTIAFPFGFLLPFAGVGIYCALKERVARIPILLAYLAAVGATSLVFFVVARYRLPAVPILSIFAGMGGVYLFEKRRRDMLGWGILGGLLVVSNLPSGPMETTFTYDSYYLLAVSQQGRGDIGHAEGNYLMVLEKKPDYYEARNNLAIIYCQTGRLVEAAGHLTYLLRDNPTYAPALFNLGNMYRRLGATELARRQYARALNVDPDLAAAASALEGVAAETLSAPIDPGTADTLAALLRQLTDAFMDRQQRELAKEIALDALFLAPRDVTLHNNLATIHYSLGQTDEARKEFRTALDIDPRFVPALVNLGRLEKIRGNRKVALMLFRKALSIDPDNKLAQEETLLISENK